jgi:hypothetical protein
VEVGFLIAGMACGVALQFVTPLVAIRGWGPLRAGRELLGSLKRRPARFLAATGAVLAVDAVLMLVLVVLMVLLVYGDALPPVAGALLTAVLTGAALGLALYLQGRLALALVGEGPPPRRAR